MGELKFTIITPSYNQGDYLEEAICSVLNQEYTNFEYFVIDGGSKDHSVSIIERFSDRIDWWVSEKDNGQSHAINKGIERASGDILIWINSDDLLKEGALRTVLTYFLRNPDVDVIHGQTELFRGNKCLIRGAQNANLPEQYLAGMAFPQPSAFIRMSALRTYHPFLNQKMHYGMDFDLFACLYLNGNFLSVNDTFSRYRLHSESKTVLTNEGFANDWQHVFSKIIYSMGEKEIQEGLLGLGMWHESTDIYPVGKTFGKAFVSKSLQYFLEFQINFYYRDLKFKKVRILARFISKNFPEFYTQRNIRRLYLISITPFSRYLIPLLRKSTF